MSSMKNGFGLNTNLFETNILNLRVVIGVVRTVVGDAVRSLLDQRRKTILVTLQEVDQKARNAQQRLDEARAAVETARARAQEIRAQAIQTVEQESVIIQKKLKEDLQRRQEIRQQVLQLEQQQRRQTIAQKVANLAIMAAEDTLLIKLGPMGPMHAKQKELNEVHVRETFRKLKRLFFYIIFL